MINNNLNKDNDMLTINILLICFVVLWALTVLWICAYFAPVANETFISNQAVDIYKSDNNIKEFDYKLLSCNKVSKSEALDERAWYEIYVLDSEKTIHYFLCSYDDMNILYAYNHKTYNK